MKNLLPAWLAVALAASTTSGGIVPDGSAMAQADDAGYQRLLVPLVSTQGVHPAAWKLDGLRASAVAEPEPRVGAAALRLDATAQSAGAKGDVGVFSHPGSELRRLGLWVHLAEDSNVARVGLQVIDAEGEAFLLAREADWRGWGWVEFDLAEGELQQAYRQPERNGQLDQPLRHINVAWFTSAAGPTHLTVNALVATASEPAADTAHLVLPQVAEPDAPARFHVAIHNPGDTAATIALEYQLQRDAQLLPLNLPHPVHGSDHALGAASWTELRGEEVERGSLTDAEERTSYRLPWHKDYTELLQYVDLGQPRRVTHLAYESGDANWAWALDVAASNDGVTWRDVPGLQGVDVHKRWGAQQIAVDEPFEARYLRLRYHKGGETSNTLGAFTRLSVFDGVADETWALPEAGEAIASGTVSVEVGPRGLFVAAIGEGQPLPTGAYLCSVRVAGAAGTQVLADRLFVMPDPVTAEQQRRARVGLNSSTDSYAETHRRLGIGWVRFENLKWRMASPEPGRYVYDGLHPWYVNHDRYVRMMAEHNIETLPYLFMSPEWASSAPVDSKHRAAWPPKDNADYADFVFQTVARYGSKKHDSEALKTEDKLSGLNLLSVYELWNEPNLNDPNWGHWVGRLEDYFEMFRAGAEAAKRADPAARVANGGFAGISLDLVDQLRSYTYADGKRPLDFVDVLSVHTYTGASAPELSRVDTNVNRAANAEAGASHEEMLRRLDAWRDEHRPEMPIWMTETGYDSGGPRAVPERMQAAYNVRNCMIMLAAGIDKVFIYREVGSGDGLYAASGLQRNDSSFKPSWFAVATLLRQLDGAEAIQRLPHPNPEVHLFGWQRDGEWTLAGWTTEGNTYAVELPVGAATLTDSFGGVSKLGDASGLVLTEMPVYLHAVGNPSVIDELAQRGAAERERWRRARGRLAEARAVLFDFGKPEHLGSVDLGGPRRMTPVPHDTLYSAERGYGFDGQPGIKDEDAGWIRDPVQRDSVRVDGNRRFVVDLPKGTHRVRLDVMPVGDTETVVNLQVDGGDTVPLRATKEQPQAEATVTTPGGRLGLAFTDHAVVRSLVIVEAPE